MDRQWSLFLAMADFSGIGRLTVASVELARRASVGGETATQTLRWCSDLGLLTGGRGKFAVTDTGWDIAKRWHEDRDHARMLLQAPFLAHWSVQAIKEPMRHAPVPAETLAKWLQAGLPGSPRRGMYLIEWLSLAFLVHRDQQGLVWPAPALGVVAASEPTAVPADACGQEPEQELNFLMGTTNSTLRGLPCERYCSVLDSLAQVVELIPA
ncbi:hypothetical protein AB0D74_43145 [Streptomyces sp. NPDC048278]|uniref:hypothetical protein n=1 Tax=Streptomyces sp. NPDC048278 TaxID=3155809 RepID=UPI003429A16E